MTTATAEHVEQEKRVEQLTLKILSANRGDKEIFIEGDDPADRKALAETMATMRKLGYTFFYRVKGEKAFTRVDGYDQANNSYILGSGKSAKRVPAAGTEITAIAAVAGG